MSREIKFRAWVKASENIGYVMMQDRDLSLVFKLNNRGGFEKYHALDYKLMQYTGLKDKNGKEIYEGDIVKGKITNYSIEFKQSGGWVTSDNLPLWAFHEPEVIGNIYENPDLLKGEPNE